MSTCRRPDLTLQLGGVMGVSGKYCLWCCDRWPQLQPLLVAPHAVPRLLSASISRHWT